MLRGPRRVVGARHLAGTPRDPSLEAWVVRSFSRDQLRFWIPRLSLFHYRRAPPSTAGRDVDSLQLWLPAHDERVARARDAGLHVGAPSAGVVRVALEGPLDEDSFERALFLERTLLRGAVAAAPPAVDPWRVTPDQWPALLGDVDDSGLDAVGADVLEAAAELATHATAETLSVVSAAGGAARTVAHGAGAMLGSAIPTVEVPVPQAMRASASLVRDAAELARAGLQEGMAIAAQLGALGGHAAVSAVSSVASETAQALLGATAPAPSSRSAHAAKELLRTLAESAHAVGHRAERETSLTVKAADGALRDNVLQRLGPEVREFSDALLDAAQSGMETATLAQQLDTKQLARVAAKAARAEALAAVTKRQHD